MHSQSVHIIVGLVFCMIVFAAWIWIEQRPVPHVAPPAEQKLTIDKSPRAQNDRKVLIDGLVDQGLVRKIETEPGSSSLRVSLRPTFYTKDEGTRKKYIDVIYAYYFDGSNMNDTVILRDARHGNEVGRYNPYSGGLSMVK